MTELAELTERHRRLQIGVASRTVQLMHASWGILDPDDLDGSFATWLRVVRPIVDAQRIESSNLAGDFYLAAREIADVASLPPRLLTAGPVELRQLATSMLITGPASIRAARARGVAPGRAVAVAEARAARAAMRHTLNAGRDTITRTVGQDEAAHGWHRIASGTACKFCHMLATRGAVYRAGIVDFRAHDGCSCTAAPSF